jgi:hypothetical protein
MKGPGLQTDERTVSISRKICTRLYFLTIAALWLDVCWRQFISGQPLEEFIDLAVLMTANVIFVIGAMLYYGGIAVPKIRASAVVMLYCVCVAVGTGFTIYKYHMGSAREILFKVVLISAITGVVVLLYVVAAYLGSRKADRKIEE